MARKLPVDFEQKVKQPPNANGTGYPYRISARDLMDNYKYLLNLMPEGGSPNDMLYWTGTEWRVLPGPSAADNFALEVSSGSLQWAEKPATSTLSVTVYTSSGEQTKNFLVE